MPRNNAPSRVADELAFGPDINKVVVIVTDHGDESSRGDVLEQFLFIGDRWDAWPVVTTCRGPAKPFRRR